MLTMPEIEGEHVLVLNARLFVQSKSQPEVFYLVSDEGECECPGYTYRQTCRHSRAASAYRRLLWGGKSA